MNQTFAIESFILFCDDMMIAEEKLFRIDRCQCCGKIRKPTESFEEIFDNGSVCVNCSRFLYFIKDKESTIRQKESASEEIQKCIDKGKASKEFIEWYSNWEFNQDKMQIVEEKLETNILDKTLAKSMYLYHASYLKLSTIKPTSLNMGTRLSRKRLSSFWTNSLEHSIMWALDWLGVRFDIDVIHDIERKKVYFPDVDGRKESDGKDAEFRHISKLITESLVHKPVYVYGAEIPMKHIGRGQVPIDEYTVDIPVTPDRVIEINGKNVFSFNVIEFIPIDEYNKMVDEKKGIYRKEKLSFTERLVFKNPVRTLKRRSKMYKKGKVPTEYYDKEI